MSPQTVKFAVCVMDHPGKTTHGYFDLCKYIAFGLEALGFECAIVRNELPLDAICIVVGTAVHRTPHIAGQLRHRGEYILLQTEIIETGHASAPDAHGLNAKISINPEVTRDFAAIHLPCMRYAAAVWTGTPSCVPELAKLGIRADLLHGGYLAAMDEIKPAVRKDIDFLFYGSEVPHRFLRLLELERRGAKIVRGRDAFAIFRNSMIARAKVVLCPNHGPHSDYMGWAKIIYLLNNHALPVVETCRDQDDYAGCFPTAPTAQWADLCMETLARPDREEAAAAYHERFKTIRFEEKLRPLVMDYLHRRDGRPYP